MIVSGQKIISFSSQPNGFSYGVDVLGSSPTGTLSIQLSGQSGVLLGFVFQSGRL